MNSVSVLMPARNAEATIEVAVRSVLLQPGLHEIVVVDDKSHDSTSDILRRINDARIVVVPGEGRGIACALNLALDHACGLYVARCDADDRYPPGRLAWQAEWLEHHPDYVAISGGFRSVTADMRVVAELACDGDGRDVTDLLLDGAPVTHFCTWLTRRDAIVAAGGAREWFTTAEDIDLMCRLAGSGRVWHEPRPVYDYRLHNASIVHQQSDAQRLFFEQSAKAFAIERRAGSSDQLERGHPPLLPADAGARTSAAMQAAGLLEGAAWVAFDAQRHLDALRLIGRSILQMPSRPSAWRSLAIFLVRSLTKQAMI